MVIRSVVRKSDMDEAKAAILILRALVEELAASGVLAKDDIARIMERAKALSDAEPLRYSKRGEDHVLNEFRKAFGQ